jgi:hypothetical protein
LNTTRRHFLTQAAAVSAGFLLLRAVDDWLVPALADVRALGLRKDPEGIIDLPRGFSYVAFSRVRDRMTDGLLVPEAHDGMAAFPGPNGRVILVRNHELSADRSREGAWHRDPASFARTDRKRVYDAGDGESPGLGGTTTLVYDPAARRLERHFLSLAGTYRNCGGGVTPWGTWISCEEDVTRAGEHGAVRDHGFAFEVPPRVEGGLVEPLPLVAMGRFRREAVAFHASGAVYQTEDRADGLLYRFLPDSPRQLARGGRLQALRVRGMSRADLRNWEEGPRVEQGQKFDVEWVDLQDVTAPNDDLRLRAHHLHGAALFARAEGIHTGSDGVYFCATNGGGIYQGQIWRYVPSAQEGRSEEENAPGTLELFVESPGEGVMQNPDNVCVSPWGELFVCEDSPGGNFVLRVARDGSVRKFAHSVLNESELAGATFSPDGKTFFVNLQDPGLTVAVTGPWEELEGRS